MRVALAVLLISHALIHLLGFLEAFGFAEVPQLTVPISKPLGVAWLVATLALLGAAAALFAAPRSFWLMGAFGILVSQFVIVSSWSDARLGTILNLVALLAVLHGAFSQGPFGLRAAYQKEVRHGLTVKAATPVVTEADLDPLPAPVQRYLRLAGVVGQPLVQNYRIRFVGRIRSAADAPWMEFTAEQLSFADPPRRLFMMNARMKGLPVDVFHSYIDAQARMRVKLLSLYPMVDAGGFDFTTAETVTIFNDMCVMAPATLISRAITWKVIDDKTVEGTFTNSAHTISARLYFDDSGALVSFTSDDRPGLAPDGKTLVPQRWSTPLTGYRAYGKFWLASHGDARYAPTAGAFTYGEFDLQDVAYNVASSE
jgi:uncharacterized protein DUF6544